MKWIKKPFAGGIYLFKVIIGNTTIISEIFSKCTMKAPKQR